MCNKFVSDIIKKNTSAPVIKAPANTPVGITVADKIIAGITIDPTIVGTKHSLSIILQFLFPQTLVIIT